MRTSELYRFFFCVVKTESECPKNECVLASCIEFLVLPFLCVLSRMYTYQVYVCVCCQECILTRCMFVCVVKNVYLPGVCLFCCQECILTRLCVCFVVKNVYLPGVCLCVLSRMYTYQVYVCFVVKIPSDLISYAGPPEPSTQSKLLVVKVGFVGSGFARIPSLVRLLCRF